MRGSGRRDANPSPRHITLTHTLTEYYCLTIRYTTEPKLLHGKGMREVCVFFLLPLLLLLQQSVSESVFPFATAFFLL